jgi:hypothetical protein
MGISKKAVYALDHVRVGLRRFPGERAGNPAYDNYSVKTDGGANA